MTASRAAGGVLANTWLADEMLGRLARYLRFFGWDTEYVRGLEDTRVAELARTSGRILLTRDRALAGRVEPSLLLRSVGVREQLSEVFAAYPDEPRELKFDRCPEDNQPLHVAASADAAGAEHVPRDLGVRGIALWTCGRFYWEGGHAAKIRAIVAEAAARAGSG